MPPSTVQRKSSSCEAEMSSDVVERACVENVKNLDLPGSPQPLQSENVIESLVVDDLKEKEVRSNGFGAISEIFHVFLLDQQKV